ncbi:PAS domain S-box protein [Dankookia rubra]|uniref:histidine kinase n=1 Tax=Dankookia rubra TaxID=1442381 RepID=A0A4R5QG44_9PROT|nr:HWE histidine kinase domain-containing protein [Dankookia rubra]TDH61521.1 PAS domain S-box protein [Dankookia rubra]
MTSPALRLHRAVMAASLLVPMLVFAAAAWWNRGEVLREGTDAVDRTSAVMQEHAAKVFDTANLILAWVADHVGRLDAEAVAAPATSDLLRSMASSFDQIVSVWVADADGQVRAGSQAWDPSVSIADREFFRVQRERADAGSHVSAAFTGRATTIASFAVSRRRSDAAGNFAGTIHVALSPDYFARFYAEAAPPFRHAAALFRADGAILVRQPALPGAPDRVAPTSPVFRRVGEGQARATFTDVSSLDGRRRVYSYRRVGTWPIYVSFGADADSLLDRWHGNLRVYGAVAAAAALTLLLVTWLALRGARAAEAAEAALRREATARAAAEARQAAEQRFRAVFESRAVGMAVLDLASGKMLVANDRLLEMTGTDRKAFEAGDWDWRRVTAPEHVALSENARREAQADGWWQPFEKDYLRPDGLRLPVRVSSAPLPGEPGRVVVLVQDISEQREAELRRDLLMREVDHRAKNVLATARAVLRLSRATSLDGFVREVDGRIGALAQALALLSNTQWHGVELDLLARQELAVFLSGAEGGPRAELRGPAVTITATAVQPLAMAIHELATNATKYGALSRPHGVLTLEWEVLAEQPERLRLVWRERGGPPVTVAPAGRGFGSRVLQATLTRQLGGTLSLCWDPKGLRCEIVLPAARVLARAEAVMLA